LTPRAEIVKTTANTAVVRLLWRPKGEAEDRELFQVVRMRGDKIRELADYRTARAAARAAS
jgi:hypothetical protein